MDPNRHPGIKLGQIVVEKASFSHRSDYLGLTPRTDIGALPILFRVELKLSDSRKEGVVRLALQTDPSKNPHYVLDIALVAVLEVVKGDENMQIEEFASVSGGALLMPFMRELVANLTARGRFGPVWLNPINMIAAREGEMGAAKRSKRASPSTAKTKGSSRRR